MTNEEKMEVIRLQMKGAYSRLKHDYQLMKRSEHLFKSLEARYFRSRDEWESLDRQLAMLDGRFERLMAAQAANEPKTKQRKEKKLDLTAEDIIKIAQTLGIVLPEVD